MSEGLVIWCEGCNKKVGAVILDAADDDTALVQRIKEMIRGHQQQCKHNQIKEVVVKNESKFIGTL